MQHVHGSCTEKVSLLWKRSPARQKPERHCSETQDQPNRSKNIINGSVVTLFCIYIYMVGYYGFLNTFDSCKFTFLNKYPGKTKFKAIQIKI